MPIYEYTCTECGHELEELQKMSDPPLTECPACRQQTLRKKVSAAGFQLKGSGWYATDFRDKGKPPKTEAKEAKADSGKSADSAGDGGKKTENAASGEKKTAGADKAA